MNARLLDGFHLHSREWRFLGLVLLTLALIGWYLALQGSAPQAAASSWRRVDTAAVRRHIEAGDLSTREADWYHAATPAERGAARSSPWLR